MGRGYWNQCLQASLDRPTWLYRPGSRAARAGHEPIFLGSEALPTTFKKQTSKNTSQQDEYKIMVGNQENIQEREIIILCSYNQEINILIPFQPFSLYIDYANKNEVTLSIHI